MISVPPPPSGHFLCTVYMHGLFKQEGYLADGQTQTAKLHSPAEPACK